MKKYYNVDSQCCKTIKIKLTLIKDRNYDEYLLTLALSCIIGRFGTSTGFPVATTDEWIAGYKQK